MKINEIIKFGRYDWRVLDIQDDNALIITQDIIQYRLYDDFYAGEVWEDCSLRQYLNDEFLHSFMPEEQARIVQIKNHNSNNPWYNTDGGEDTYDRIFLLSIEEAYRYFGGCGEISVNKSLQNDDNGFFSDSNDNERIAKYRGKPGFWWLRSPGSQCVSGAFMLEEYEAGFVAFVSDSGFIGMVGMDYCGFIDVGGIGIRPVLCLKS